MWLGPAGAAASPEGLALWRRGGWPGLGAGRLWWVTGHPGLPLTTHGSTVPGSDSCARPRAGRAPCWLASRRLGCTRPGRQAGRQAGAGRQVWSGQGPKAKKHRGHAPQAGKTVWLWREWNGQAGLWGWREGQDVGKRESCWWRKWKKGCESEPAVHQAEVGGRARRGGLSTRGRSACGGGGGVERGSGSGREGRRQAGRQAGKPPAAAAASR